MSDIEKVNLLELFGKKLNRLTVIIISVLGLFVVLFVSFMITSSSKQGIHDTQINQLYDMQKETNVQINKIIDATNILITDNEVKQTEFKNLLELLNSTNTMAKKTEWAVLTGNKNIITRDVEIKK